MKKLAFMAIVSVLMLSGCAVYPPVTQNYGYAPQRVQIQQQYPQQYQMQPQYVESQYYTSVCNLSCRRNKSCGMF